MSNSVSENDNDKKKISTIPAVAVINIASIKMPTGKNFIFSLKKIIININSKKDRNVQKLYNII